MLIINYNNIKWSPTLKIRKLNPLIVKKLIENNFKINRKNKNFNSYKKLILDELII